MIMIDSVNVTGINQALWGMRNPKNSWSRYDHYGPNDQELSAALNEGGPVHRKFLRQITWYVNITAPLRWWKEFDTYRLGVEKNSCSTMHKIHDKEFTLEDFAYDNMDEEGVSYLSDTIDFLNKKRLEFLNADKEEAEKAWYCLIDLLPDSYMQMRSCLISFEALANMLEWRTNHKQKEWRTFCHYIEHYLPMGKLVRQAADWQKTKEERVKKSTKLQLLKGLKEKIALEQMNCKEILEFLRSEIENLSE